MFRDEETVKDRLKNVFKAQGIFAGELNSEEKYELDSLSFVYLMVAIEEEFNIEIEENFIEKVIDNGAIVSLEKCEELVNKRLIN